MCWRSSKFGPELSVVGGQASLDWSRFGPEVSFDWEEDSLAKQASMQADQSFIVFGGCQGRQWLKRAVCWCGDVIAKVGKMDQSYLHFAVQGVFLFVAWL